jgi:EmrB/QacA subfamily drug resistance transporter
MVLVSLVRDAMCSDGLPAFFFVETRARHPPICGLKPQPTATPYKQRYDARTLFDGDRTRDFLVDSDTLKKRKPARPNLVLAICCMSLLLVGMDVTIVNVALPSIKQNLNAALPDLQWILDAYTIVIASLLLFMGSMSDRIGRRRTFQIGLVVFTSASFLCSLAPNIHALIAFRALQGVGGAMLNPVALAIITNTFTDPKDRARAIGIWGAAFGVALALGPLIGGVLTQTVGWRYIFLINVPIGIAAVILSALYVPESKAPRARTPDPIGQILVIAALASLTFALIEGERLGWTSTIIIGLFVTTVVAIAALLLYEPRLSEPLLELRFFRSVPFSGATLIAVTTFGAFAGFLFVNVLYLQQVRGLSALQTGLCTLPLALGSLVCGPLSGRMVASYGTRPSVLTAGSAIFLSALLLTSLGDRTSIPYLLLIYSLFGIGLGMVNPAITTVAVSGMPRSQSGVAAAVASTSRQVGAALGVAIAGAIVNSNRDHGMDFVHATHPIWWCVVGCGTVIILLGWATNTPWAQATSRNVATLLGSAQA